MNTTYPPVTIGVVTHENSFVVFENFLVELQPALATYPGDCQLVVVNNSGELAANATKSIVEKHFKCDGCSHDVIASPENNIATGRNAVFDNAKYPLVAFIDDDEFPTPGWLKNLVSTMSTYQCAAVAGPAIPLYLFPTPRWVTQVNLHGARGKTTGQQLDKCATANVLIDMAQCNEERFDPEYGRSGGEDTDFFLRLAEKKSQIRWCNEAAVYEYIPAKKSTSHYMIKRSILQGILNRRLLIAHGNIRSVALFKTRAFFVGLLCFTIGAALLCIKHENAGDWIKRGFGNVGHLLSSESTLYS